MKCATPAYRQADNDFTEFLLPVTSYRRKNKRVGWVNVIDRCVFVEAKFATFTG
jgi:hypothetical protein